MIEARRELWHEFKGPRSTAIFRCGRCGHKVLTYWAEPPYRGLLDSNEYTLVGDVVFHSTCWDECIAEYPV